MLSDPAFEPLQPLLAGCVPPGLALYTVRSGQPADLSLTWNASENPSGPAFLLGSEELVLVVHPSNHLPSLNLAVLRQVYAGKYTNWDPLGGKDLALSAWAYPGGDVIQNLFEESLLEPESLSALTHIAPGPRELRAAVAVDPGGLGFLPRRWLDASVRVLPVPDINPATLTRPLLATAPMQPQGGVKDFLLCVQDGLKTR